MRGRFYPGRSINRGIAITVAFRPAPRQGVLVVHGDDDDDDDDDYHHCGPELDILLQPR